jgi:hypothetical protein
MTPLPSFTPTDASNMLVISGLTGVSTGGTTDSGPSHGDASTTTTNTDQMGKSVVPQNLQHRL